MALFGKFRETIFLKSESNLEKSINELKEIRNTLHDTSKIDKDIKLLEIGLQGEKEIEFELKNSNIGMYVLHDINIEFEDLKAQIDYVIVTKAYTYLVECKNMIGNITINENGEFQREYNYNGKKIVEGIYSPYRQALRHKEVLKKVWLSKHNKISTLLWENSFDKNYKPLAVLTNSKGLLDLRYAPKEIKTATVRSDGLIEYIKKDIAKYDKDLYLSKKSMESWAMSILNRNVLNNNQDLEKYKNDDINNNLLMEKLKEYRRNKAKEKNIPAYYIFTDNEMEQIIKLHPKNYDELAKSNILNQTKLKFHGAEIIKVINNN